MIQKSLTGMAVAVAGVALSIGAGAGVASAAPDLGPAINTTCNYEQLVSALHAQDPNVANAFNQMPILQRGLRDFIAAGPDARTRQAHNVSSAPAFQPYIGTIAAAFNTCNNF